MHIPDGYLSPPTYGAFYGLMAVLWIIGGRKLRKTLSSKRIPFLGLGAAFSFVIMMFNIPLPGGTSGHPVGSTLISLVIGPWAAFLAVSVALVIQAFFFGDGGITAIAANSFNMAFAMPFAGYYLNRLLSRGARSDSSRTIISAGIAGYVSLNLCALLTGIELGIQPLIAHGLDGRPLYFPYALRIVVPAMLLGHLLFLGFVEAAVTAFVVAYLRRAEPSLLEIPQRQVKT